MTLRQRIVLALAPLVCLLALIGATAIVLLRHVGDRIEDILRENYASVEAMTGLNKALEAHRFVLPIRPPRQGRCQAGI